MGLDRGLPACERGAEIYAAGRAGWHVCGWGRERSLGLAGVWGRLAPKRTKSERTPNIHTMHIQKIRESDGKLVLPISQVPALAGRRPISAESCIKGMIGQHLGVSTWTPTPETRRVIRVRPDGDPRQSARGARQSYRQVQRDYGTFVASGRCNVNVGDVVVLEWQGDPVEKLDQLALYCDACGLPGQVGESYAMSLGEAQARAHEIVTSPVLLASVARIRHLMTLSPSDPEIVEMGT